VLLVEHHMKVVMAVCQEVKVLAFGATIAEGPALEVGKDPKVLEAYRGAYTRVCS